MDIVLLIIIGYLLLMLGIAWYFSKKESLEDYFLNKRSTNIWLLTFSHFSTMVGAAAVIGLISEVYNSGIAVGIAMPISYLMGSIVMGITAKRIRTLSEKYKARTIVDFFEKRFDRKNRNLLIISQLFLLLIWISVQAVAISSLASILIGIDRNLAVLITGGITILYTAIGGLKIDIISDFIQSWIIIGVFVALAYLGFNEIGSISNLFSSLPAGHLNISNFNGIAWFIGVIAISGFVYLGNATHWQRTFSASSASVARRSYFYLAPMIIPFCFIVVFLGLLSAVTITGVYQDQAVFVLMKNLLPGPLVGLGYAAILAVIMSSIDSLLITGSTILFNALFPKVKDTKKQVFHARILTAVFGVAGFVVAYLVPSIITLALLVAYFAFLFVPAIIGALFSEKFSANASFYSLLIPMILFVGLYPAIGNNIFMLTMPVGIVIAVFYDRTAKLFKKNI